jgi:hypothetical protein
MLLQVLGAKLNSDYYREDFQGYLFLNNLVKTMFTMFLLMHPAMSKVLVSLLMTHNILSRLLKVLMAHYIAVLLSEIEWVAGN